METEGACRAAGDGAEAQVRPLGCGNGDAGVDPEDGLRREVEHLRATVAATRLRPHFLLNALHVVSVLLQQGRVGAARSALTALAGQLRYVVEADGRRAVTLADEIAFVRDYVRVEALRFDRDPRLEVEAEDGVMDATVPPLVLQPLVENALRHGGEGRADGITVRIRARRQAGELRLEVADDGRGLPKGWSMASHAGTGLRGVRARLEHATTGRGSLRLRDRAEGGARVTLRLPCVPAPARGPSGT